MPFCPKCGYEYNPEISVCPDCDERLVPFLPDNKHIGESELGKQYENWVAIGVLTSGQMAEMLLEGLRAKEIPALLKSSAGYFGFTGQMGVSSYLPAGAGYTLLVPREFVADAMGEAEVMLGEEWRKFKIIEIG